MKIKTAIFLIVISLLSLALISCEPEEEKDLGPNSVESQNIDDEDGGFGDIIIPG